MNKEELVTVIWSKLDGITKDEVRIFLTAMLDSIGHCLANGNNIKLKDFGKFEISERKAHMVIHPKTKERCPVPKTISVKFKPSGWIKESLNENRK